MSITRLMGHLLLWAGFLSAALVAVRRTEVPDDPWATINWAAYGFCLGLAVAGVVLLRRTSKSSLATGDEHGGNVDEMLAALKRLSAQLKDWNLEGKDFVVQEIHHRIDEQLADDLSTFSERRQSLVHAFGLDSYAQIMTEFALAERTINRMWSASADGYIDEVKLCRDRAIEHLEQAKAQLESTMSNGKMID